MFISDSIAKLIEEMLENSDGILELRRNDLADQLGCVPSQINYVIASRFTPAKGYITESRRGGGGYIRIEKIRLSGNEYLMHFFFSIGDKLDGKTALALIRNLHDNGALTERESDVCRGVLSCISSDSQRADAMRQIVMAIMKHSPGR
ncbi:MAG: CtsR family transcriptional regulator [Clostridia bacterium]|nr:CtsR family transcriptional regulator [Clostridia bacterium]